MQPESENTSSNWSFQPESPAPQAGQQPQPTTNEPITWTGSEYLAQHKDAGWYLGLFFAIAAVSVVAFILTKGDLLSVAFIVIIGILFGVIAGKPPRQLQYRIDTQGITVGGNHYAFDAFKSFSLMHDGAIGYISLLPLKRLKPELTIYFAPTDEQRIFDTLARYLPYEQRTEGTIDRFSKRIRF
jgi:hypothetical protein